MCGIVGAIAQRDVSKILLTGIQRLEYRGYDSAGIAILDNHQKLHCLRTIEKVKTLESKLNEHPIFGKLGIAHTRWATHGKPTERNAHPHASHDEIVLVHNGIIENHAELRKHLEEQGYEFASETDSEVIAHLMHAHLKETGDFLQAVKKSVDELQGAYALAIMNVNEPHRLIGVRKGSPLVVGVGIGENFLGSDNLALLPVTQAFIYLHEGDIVDLSQDKIDIYDAALNPIKREIQHSTQSSDMTSKGRYRHFMLKEIFDQPQALSEILEGRMIDHHILSDSFGVEAQSIFKKIKQVQIIACGTSYHAGLVARYWIEEFTGTPCQVEIASEIRYRHAAVMPDTLLITISQSGETADTLAALRQAKDNPNYLASLCICNVPESSIVRESDIIVMTRAGMEVGVASTKAFTTQLVALLMMTVLLGRHHGMTKETEETEGKLVDVMQTLPRLVEKALTLNFAIEKLAHQFTSKEHALFLGRGVQFPIALEGALKLKEISYIHAEAYPTGELKHGPLALVDPAMPVIVLLPADHLVDKVKSNIEEVQARGGQMIVFADEGLNYTDKSSTVLHVPHCDPIVAPIVFTIPLQLLAYHVAILKGTDVDQPRNLAKSVTVE